VLSGRGRLKRWSSTGRKVQSENSRRDSRFEGSGLAIGGKRTEFRGGRRAERSEAVPTSGGGNFTGSILGELSCNQEVGVFLEASTRGVNSPSSKKQKTFRFEKMLRRKKGRIFVLGGGERSPD